MSTLVLRALLRFLEKGGLNLCQEFVWYNSARLPSPIEWVNKERIRVKDAFTRIWTGEVENDGFNKLVPGAGLAWRQVVLLRSYCKFLRQAAIPFSQAYMEETLASNPAIARMIVELFETLFDPAGQDTAAARCKRLRRRIEKALDAVAVLDAD